MLSSHIKHFLHTSAVFLWRWFLRAVAVVRWSAVTIIVVSTLLLGTFALAPDHVVCITGYSKVVESIEVVGCGIAHAQSGEQECALLPDGHLPEGCEVEKWFYHMRFFFPGSVTNYITPSRYGVYYQSLYESLQTQFFILPLLYAIFFVFVVDGMMWLGGAVWRRAITLWRRMRRVLSRRQALVRGGLVVLLRAAQCVTVLFSVRFLLVEIASTTARSVPFSLAVKWYVQEIFQDIPNGLVFSDVLEYFIENLFSVVMVFSVGIFAVSGAVWIMQLALAALWDEWRGGGTELSVFRRVLRVGWRLLQLAVIVFFMVWYAAGFFTQHQAPAPPV